MALLNIVHDAWGFSGLTPRSVLDVSAFGNLLLEDDCGCYWRISPEELSCEIVARSQDELERLRGSDAFRTDWEMARLVAIAVDHLGRPGPDRCFCLKVPAVLGGLYEASNFGTISVTELVASAGALALQIRDLPDGTPVTLKVVD